VKVKISRSEEYGTVITLTAESKEEAEAIKDLWNRKGKPASLEVDNDNDAKAEIEIATTE